MQARFYEPTSGRFLSIDPVGFSPARPDMFNRYTYAANDPVNMWDPDGEKSYLVSRGTGWRFPGKGEQGHLFVVVVNDETGNIDAQFSFGPDKAIGGRLVQQIQGDSIFETDRAAFEDGTGTRVEINASDDAVMKSGEAVASALGTKENPGNTNYAPLTNPASDSNYGNGNSAAYAVANRATTSENPVTEQSLPSGTRNPGWDQDDHIPD
jgi:hypothetical protein